ncbi:uncharacterized protein LOC127748353 [Arachis duranensis]|nr:uncharacterized protein LOC127748353 [Arachis duranensis]XP_052118638.1 uncharacterized protein LOC127748353 [Arachis duranensis]RYR54296.1 hypothetical protein Ahy_A06g029553 isoform B [Arachis hypogaea]
MLKVDKATSIHSRGRFTSIRVEIDLSKKLVPRISVLDNILNIEYEGFNYRIYGYRSESCGEILATEEVHRAAMEEGKQVEAEGVLEAVNHGKQETITNNLSIDNKSENNQSMDMGSRYNVLYDDKEEETLEDINVEENEQISTMHSGPWMDLHMKEGEPSNPIQVENLVVAKGSGPSLQIQKRVLKTGAGKNPQAQKKGLSFNLRPLKTGKTTKAKLKEAEKKVIGIKKSLGVAQPSAFASRNP